MKETLTSYMTVMPSKSWSRSLYEPGNTQQKTTMYTFNEAIKIIREKYLKKSYLNLAIINEATIEKNFGWIFFYTTREFLETGDFRYSLAGNGPIFFNKETGDTYCSSSAFTLESNIRIYELKILKIKHYWSFKFERKLSRKDKTLFLKILKMHFPIDSTKALKLMNSKFEINNVEELLKFGTVSSELKDQGVKHVLKKE